MRISTSSLEDGITPLNARSNKGAAWRVKRHAAPLFDQAAPRGLSLLVQLTTSDRATSATSAQPKEHPDHQHQE